MSKHTTKPEPKMENKPESKPEPKTAVTAVSAPILTPELVAQLRAADSLDAGVSILAPSVKPKAKSDATYELNTSCVEPLPQKRGACLKVVTAAVRLNRPFKVADIVEQLPEIVGRVRRTNPQAGEDRPPDRSGELGTYTGGQNSLGSGPFAFQG